MLPKKPMSKKPVKKAAKPTPKSPAVPQAQNPQGGLSNILGNQGDQFFQMQGKGQALPPRH